VADRSQIHQVLLNLLLNALDELPSGGTVQVHMRRAEDPRSERAADPSDVSNGRSDCVLIQVADTGKGLPTALGDRIFEPFVSSKDTGTGLGLTISRRIIEAHGGQITAASRPEGGAIVTVQLPVGSTAATSGNCGAAC
jgi:signal transduction histidine kinase